MTRTTSACCPDRAPVWLQSMPLSILAASLAPFLGDTQDKGKAVEGGDIGGVISDLLK